MEFLKKQSTACLIMVVLIILSVFVGSNRSLHRLVLTGEDLFWYGAYEYGASIAYDMESNLGIAYNLQTVAGRYLDGKDSDMRALASSIEQMDRAETISDMAKGNEAITKNVLAVSAKVLAMDIAETDYRYTAGFVNNLNGNNERISKDPYNETALSINKELSSFPASLLRIPAGVKKLTVFT